MKKRILYLLFTTVICFVLTSCNFHSEETNKTNAQLYIESVELLSSRFDVEGDDNEKQSLENLCTLGIVFNENNTSSPKITVDDVADILKSYSIEELLHTSYDIHGFIKHYNDEEYFEGYSVDENFDLPNYMFGLVLELKKNELVSKDEFLKLENEEGFYSKNKKAEPKKGNDEARIEIKYFGDFATKKYDTTEYNEGKYEWKNGVFYDEPGYNYTAGHYELYYKGFLLVSDLYTAGEVNMLTDNEKEYFFVEWIHDDWVNWSCYIYENGKLDLL